MILREITISGLYGYLNKSIQFRPDINLLVGINGSGKTSILNLISWMLNAECLPHLCVTQFKNVSLKLQYNNVGYEIVCRKTARQLTYSIRGAGQKSPLSPPLVVPLRSVPLSLPEGFDPKRLYEGLTPVPKELGTYNLLQQIPKPMVLGVDRAAPRTQREPSIRPKRQPAVGSLVPLQELANQNYSIYQSRIIELNNKIRDRIVLSAFNSNRLIPPKSAGRITATQIRSYRERFSAYLRQTPKPKSNTQKEITRAVEKYFSTLERLVSRRIVPVQSIAAIRVEFLQLQHLIKRLEDLDHESEQAFGPIRRYLDTVNGFFSDSSKELSFSRDTNRLCFRVYDRKRSIPEDRDVALLSSGENQILSLLTYIAFAGSKVFIIDEPELSLHPKWQEGFLGAVKTLMPKSAQLIVATHSPSIVGIHREYCKVLLPYNK